MIKTKSATAKSLEASVLARKDIFQVIEKLPAFLTAEKDDSLRKNRLEKFLVTLHKSAYSGLTEYEQSEKRSEFPCYCCDYQEANWIWLDRELDLCRKLRYPEALDFLLAYCEIFKNEYSYGISDHAYLAETILRFMERKYGYLSRVITPRGLHFLALPSVASQSKTFEFSSSSLRSGGIRTSGIIFASEYGDENSILLEPAYLIYESIGATILEQCGIGEQLSDAVLSLLERYWDPQIRKQRPEDQIGAYYDAILMGLSTYAPCGKFDAFKHYDEGKKEFWSDHAGELICEIGKGATPA